MLNQVILVGRLQDYTSLGNDVIEATLTVVRNFKNEQGEYEADTLPVLMSDHLAKSTQELCTVGSTVGIKGRLVCNGSDRIELVAEKVTFINTRGDN